MDNANLESLFKQIIMAVCKLPISDERADVTFCDNEVEVIFHDKNISFALIKKMR